MNRHWANVNCQPRDKQSRLAKKPKSIPNGADLAKGREGQTQWRPALSLTNVLTNSHLIRASMVIPSNDGFFGNDNGMLYELFDNMGNFNGPLTINLLGGNIWDSGTEVNNPLGGAAFFALGGTSLDEGGVIAVHTGFDDFLGTNTAAGTTIGSIPEAATPFVTIRITAVPEPMLSWC